jgi:archaellin
MASFEDYASIDSRLFVIPNDMETRDDLLAIDRKTKEDVRLKHRLFVNTDWEANTITNVYVESLIRVLYSHIKNNGVHVLSDDADNSLTFYDLLEIAATNKKNENAEKTGNINIKFMPGKDVEGIISDDVPDDKKPPVEFIEARAMFSFPDDAATSNAMQKIDTIAQKELKEKYSIILPNTWHVTAIAYAFIENIYRYLATKLVKTDKSSVMLNFNDIIEFHAIRKGDAIDIKLRPGMGAKLIIKSDESTEIDDDGGSDEYDD